MANSHDLQILGLISSMEPIKWLDAGSSTRATGRQGERDPFLFPIFARRQRDANDTQHSSRTPTRGSILDAVCLPTCLAPSLSRPLALSACLAYLSICGNPGLRLCGNHSLCVGIPASVCVCGNLSRCVGILWRLCGHMGMRFLSESRKDP